MPVLGGIDHPVMLGGGTQPESPSSAGAAPQRQQQQRPRPASAAAPAAPADIPVISAVRKLVSYTGRGCQNVLVDEPGSIVGRESKSLAWVGGADETKCVVELHRSRRAQRDHPFVRVALTPSSARAAPAVCTLLTSSSPHAGFARVHRSRVEGAREHAVRLPLQGLDRYLCVLLSGGTGHSHRVARLEVMLVPDAPQRRGVDDDEEAAAAATVAAAAASEEDVASSAAAPPVAPTPQRYDGGGGGGARGGNDHSSISNVSCIEPSGPREGPRSRGAYGGGGGGGGSSGEVFDDDAAPPPPKTAQSPQCAWAVRPQSRLAEQEGEEKAVVRPPVMPGHAADGDSRHHNNNTNNDSTVVVDISASQIFGEGGPLAGLSHNYHNHLQQQGQQQPHERHNDTSLHASHLHSDPSEGTRHSGLAPRGLGFASSHNTTAAEDDDDESALVMDVTRERVEDVLMYQQQQRAQQHQHHHHHQSRHHNRSGSSSSVGSPGRRSSCASEGDAAEHLSRDAGAAVVAAVRPPAYLPELQPLRRSAPAPAVPVPPAALQAQAEEPAAAAALSQPRAAHPQLFVQEVCTVQMQAAAAVAAPSARAGAAARADQTMVIEVGGDFEQAAAAAAAGVAAHNTSRASLHTPSAAGGAWGDRSAVAVSRTLLMEQYTATPDTTPPQPVAAASRSRRDARPQHDHDHHHHRHPAAAVTPTSAGRASSGCSSVSSGAQSAPRSTESRVPSRPPPCVPSPTALSPPHTQQPPPQQQQRQHRRERAERAPAAPSSRPSGSMSMLLESVPNMGPADKLFTAAMRTLISGNISTTTLTAERSFAAASAGAGGGGGGAPPSTAAVPSLSGCRSSSAAVSAVSGQENRSVEQRLSFNTPKPRTPLEGPKKARSPLRPISRPYSL
eukprot:Rhum_TRINITY_DN11605_c0_g1::Rhum_TRINITY_DN11605_c0_g1_i1::g.45710::m.45710